MSRVKLERLGNTVVHEKLKEALHFVIESCEDNSRLGAIRLNKILWFADCHAYRANGVTITGDSYVKRKFGPVPKHVLASLRELQEDDKIVVREVSYQTRSGFREFISVTKPDTTELSETDKALLHNYTKVICSNFSAQAISDVSHDQVWEAAEEGEEIPMYAIFAGQPGSINDEVRKWANSEMSRIAA